jgi:hypothetical protein
MLTFAQRPLSTGSGYGVVVGMVLSGALSKSITAFPFGFTDRAPPQNFPDVSVRIHIDPFPLGVNRTSDLWPT